MDMAGLLKIHAAHHYKLGNIYIDFACLLSVKIWIIRCKTCLSPFCYYVSLNQLLFLLLQSFTFMMIIYRLPWDCSTPMGYFGELVYHVITGEAYLFSNAAILLLFIAMCMHHQAFCKMHDVELLELDSLEKQRSDKKCVYELIEFHVTVKRC